MTPFSVQYTVISNYRKTSGTSQFFHCRNDVKVNYLVEFHKCLPFREDNLGLRCHLHGGLRFHCINKVPTELVGEAP